MGCYLVRADRWLGEGDIMGKPISEEVGRYIEQMQDRMTRVEIATNISFIFGVYRSANTVRAYIVRKRKPVKRIAAPKVSFNASVFVPEGKPVIKNDKLLRAMTYTDTGCREIARVAGLSLEQVQGLIGRGGIPAPFADPVRAYYKAMGEMV